MRLRRRPFRILGTVHDLLIAFANAIDRRGSSGNDVTRGRTVDPWVLSHVQTSSSHCWNDIKRIRAS
jgi:hypothetical protein